MTVSAVLLVRPAAANQENAPQLANVKAEPFLAAGDGRTDDTLAIQRAIDSSAGIYLPEGVYVIDPQIGLTVRTGTTIVGAGRTKSLLLALPGGGTMEGLADYGPGSIIRRFFDRDGPNEYVAFVRLSDFAVILSHPRDRSSSDGIQIGIDLRNISRSLVERVHVGNIPPPGSVIRKKPAFAYDSQGYGIVLGTVPSGYPSYSGGELNTIENVSVWGAFKAISQDDGLLSPRSAAHATKLVGSDLQAAHFLISQESRYARGAIWRDNAVQNIVPYPAAAIEPAAIRFDGKHARIEGGYLEIGARQDRILQLGPTSENVRVDIAYVSCPVGARILDRGTGNVVVINGECRRFDE